MLEQPLLMSSALRFSTRSLGFLMGYFNNDDLWRHSLQERVISGNMHPSKWVIGVICWVCVSK